MGNRSSSFLAGASVGLSSVALFQYLSTGTSTTSSRTYTGVVIRRRKFKHFMTFTIQPTHEMFKSQHSVEVIATSNGASGQSAPRNKVSQKIITETSRKVKLGSLIQINGTLDKGGVCVIKCDKINILETKYWTNEQVQDVLPQKSQTNSKSKPKSKPQVLTNFKSKPNNKITTGNETKLKEAGYDVASNDAKQLSLENRLLRKAETVIGCRTSAVILVLERGARSHNYCACLRTAEALGIHHVWCVDPPSFDKDATERSNRKKKDQWEADEIALRDHTSYARGATKWITVRCFATTTELINELHKENREIWTTDLSQHAEPLVLSSPSLSSSSKTKDIPQIALCFGTELAGASVELLAASTRRVYLPLSGFADSLNLSVAVALVLQRVLDIYPGMVGFMSVKEKATVRTRFYSEMARNDQQRIYFHECAVKMNSGVIDIKKFVDMRRADAHRSAQGANIFAPLK